MKKISILSLKKFLKKIFQKYTALNVKILAKYLDMLLGNANKSLQLCHYFLQLIKFFYFLCTPKNFQYMQNS